MGLVLAALGCSTSFSQATALLLARATSLALTRTLAVLHLLGNKASISLFSVLPYEALAHPSHLFSIPRSRSPSHVQRTYLGNVKEEDGLAIKRRTENAGGFFSRCRILLEAERHARKGENVKMFVSFVLLGLYVWIRFACNTTSNKHTHNTHTPRVAWNHT